MLGVVASLFLVIGLFVLLWSRSAQAATGLPRGRVIYADTRAWGEVEKPLFSAAHRLVGKPDYLVREGRGRVVPVEVKSSSAPGDGPREGHILQLAAYCLLVEETTGRRPAYGIIRYADKTFSVQNTAELQSILLDALDDMRQALHAGRTERSHSDARRCARCGYRPACDESLA